MPVKNTTKKSSGRKKKDTSSKSAVKTRHASSPKKKSVPFKKRKRVSKSSVKTYQRYVSSRKAKTKKRGTKKSAASRKNKKKTMRNDLLHQAIIRIGALVSAGLFLWIISAFAIPVFDHETVERTVKVVATAYSSTVDQTDDTPCITANGFNVCENNKENVIAANFLPFGTRVRFPQLGKQIYEVHDRMNERYGYGRVDLWLKSRERAKEFGVRVLQMEILE